MTAESIKKLLEEKLSEMTDPKIRGEILTILTTVHLEAVNKINEFYLNQLKEIGLVLKDLESREKDLDRQEAIEKIKGSI